MAIQIKYDGGVYDISGFLNSQNGESLKDHFEALIEHSQGIVISLNKVLDIDSNAVNIIASLYKRAWSSDKKFYIIGMKNGKVNEQFSALHLDRILL